MMVMPNITWSLRRIKSVLNSRAFDKIDEGIDIEYIYQWI